MLFYIASHKYCKLINKQTNFKEPFYSANKFEYYEPVSPDYDEDTFKFCDVQPKSISSVASSPQSSYGSAASGSRQCKMNAKTLIDIGFCEKKNTAHRQIVSTTITSASGAMSSATTPNSIATCSSSSGGGGCNSNFAGIGKDKRHSTVTESTVSGCESDISAATTVAICDSGYGQPECGDDIGGQGGNRRRRLAINITANPGYQVMRNSFHTY